MRLSSRKIRYYYVRQRPYWNQNCYRRIYHRKFFKFKFIQNNIFFRSLSWLTELLSKKLSLMPVLNNNQKNSKIQRFAF